MRRFVVASVAGALLLPAPAVAQSLNLICEGAAEVRRVDVRGDAKARDDDGYSASADLVASHVDLVDEQANVELNADGTGRIRMPPTLTAGYIDRSKASGWYPIDKLNRTDSEITGKVKIGIVTSARLVVDRVTGRISITGAGKFTGECRRFDPATVERKF